MTDAVLTLRIRTDASGAVQVVDAVGGKLTEMGDKGRSGGAAAAAGIRETKQAAQDAERSVDRYVATLLTIGSLRVAGRLIEDFNAADARLQRALGPLADFSAAQDRALQIANRTGQVYSQTAALGSNLATALQDIGLSGEEAAQRALAIAETVNQAVALGGGSASSNQASITQLNQALASGLLRGEELNSILEQTPRLAQAIADGLGVTRGELRKLAEDSQLTTARVIDALKSQASVLKGEFADLPPAISRSFTALTNSIGRFLTDLDKAIGVTALLAGGLDLVAAAIGPLVAGVTALIGVRLAAWLAEAAVAGTAASVGLGAFGARLLALAGGVPGLVIGAATATTAWLIGTVKFAEDSAVALVQLNEQYEKTIAKQKEAAEATPEARAKKASEVLAEEEARLFGMLSRIDELKAKIGDASNPTVGPAINELNILTGNAEALAKRIERNKELTEQLGDQLVKTGSLGDAAFKALSATVKNLSGELQDATAKLFQDALKQQGVDLLELQARAALVADTFGVTVPDAVTIAARSYLGLKQGAAEFKTQLDANKKSEDALADATRKGTAAKEQQRKELERLIEKQERAAAQRTEDRDEDELERRLRIDQALADSSNTLDDYLERVEREIQLIGLNGEARAELIDSFELEALRRREIERLVAAGISQAEAETAVGEKLLAIKNAQADARAREAAEEARRTRGVFGSTVDDSGRRQPLNGFTELLGESFNQAFEQADLSSFFNRMYEGLSATFTRAAGESGAEYASRIAQSVESTANFLTGAIASFNNNPDAPLRAITEIAARIPGIVGQVAQTVAAVDALFGGRLLGTNYEVDQRGVRVAFGDEGFSGSQFTRESRQRSLFRGRRFRTTDTDLDDATADQLQGVFTEIQQIVANGARELAVTVPALVRGSFEEIRDANGRLLSRRSTVDGVTRDEDLQANTLRLVAENVIAVVAQVNAAADTLAERFRGNAEALVDAAQLMLSAQTDITQGNALFAGADLGQTVDLVERLAEPGEALVDAYTRIALASSSLQDALDQIGVSINRTGVAFVEFATELATAAGGAEEAQALFADYFQFFYSEQERTILRLQQLQTQAADALAGLGLDPNIDPAALRARIEELLPTLSPEDVVRYLEAARALGLATQAQEAYTNALRESVTAYATSAAEVSEELALFDASEYVREIAQIRTQERERVADLNRLARAAGLVAAAEDDLADVTQLTAERMARALQRLEERLRSAAGRLADADLDGRIAALERSAEESQQALGNFAGSIADVGQAAVDTTQQQIEALASLREYLDRELFGESSTLTPRQRLEEAQSQFGATAALAQGGDIDAQRRLAQIADLLLRQGVSVLGGSSAAYQDLRAMVRATIEGLIAAGPVGSSGGGGLPIGGGGGFSGGGVVDVAPSPELAALYAERDARLAEQTARERLALAQEVAGYVRELIEATGEPLTELSTRVGLSIEQLIADLGVNLDEITVATVGQLADVANQLGVELLDLATSVGLDLGNLADAQSLLNQGLQAAVQGLPEGQRQELQPLLDALTGAVTDADANSAIDHLTTVAASLGADVAEALAPFLPDLDLPPALSELDRLGSIDQRVADILAAILDPSIGNRTPSAPPVGETGTTPAPTRVEASQPLPVQQPIYVVPRPEPDDRIMQEKSVAAVESTSAGVTELRTELAQWMAQLLEAVRAGASTGAGATQTGASQVVEAVGEVVRALGDERRGS